MSRTELIAHAPELLLKPVLSDVARRHRCASGPDKEAEIASFVGLEDIFHIQSLIPASAQERGRGLPCGASTSDLPVVDLETQNSSIDIQQYCIAISYECEWPADCRLWGDVQDHSSVSRSAHSSIGNANHIRDTLCQEFRRQLSMADSPRGKSEPTVKVFEA